MSLSPPTFPETSADSAHVIVRHRVHELRNILNGLDLHAQLLMEMLPTPDTQEIVRQMRRQIEDLENSIKWLSLQFVEAAPDTVPVQDLLQLWQQQAKQLVRSPRGVEWAFALNSEAVHTDVRATVAALRELLVEAWRKPSAIPVKAAARPHGGNVEITMTVPTSPAPALTGTLAEVNRVLVRNGATFQIAPVTEGAGWVATIRLPLAD